MTAKTLTVTLAWICRRDGTRVDSVETSKTDRINTCEFRDLN
jgi:hypothetical protein